MDNNKPIQLRIKAYLRMEYLKLLNKEKFTDQDDIDAAIWAEKTSKFIIQEINNNPNRPLSINDS